MTRTALSLSYSDIDGSLRVRLLTQRQHMLPLYHKRPLVLVSCTTISCLCKSLKEHAPKGSAAERFPPQTRRSSLVCGCKGTTFPQTSKTLHDFFHKEMQFYIIYIIYYTRVRKEPCGKAQGRAITIYCNLPLPSECIVSPPPKRDINKPIGRIKYALI